MHPISVLFADLRGFTPLAERVPPQELLKLLNSFYDLATAAVLDLEGTVDKLVGDGVMAFFGAPVRSQDHAGRAVRAAVVIVRKTHALPPLADGLRLKVGGGVATGEALVGNVGGGEVRDFTVLGDVVNLASRLQDAAPAGVVLMNDDAYSSVREDFPGAEPQELLLQGKSAPVRAWALTVG